MHRMGWFNNYLLLAYVESPAPPLPNPASTFLQSPSIFVATRLNLIHGAEGRTRTDTGVAPQQFLRLPRLPFRHFGVSTPETLLPFKHS